MSEQKTLDTRAPEGLSPQAWEKLSKLDPTARVVAQALLGGRITFEPDPEAIQRDITQRILNAPSLDAALAMGQAVHSKEILGVPLVIRGFRFQESGFDKGPGTYAVIDAVHTETGEAIAVTAGSVNVMAALLKLAMENALPFEGRIVETDRPTRDGFFPQWLVKA